MQLLPSLRRFYCAWRDSCEHENLLDRQFSANLVQPRSVQHGGRTPYGRASCDAPVRRLVITIIHNTRNAIFRSLLVVSGKRYALTLQLMLKRFRKRSASTSRSPRTARPRSQSTASYTPEATAPAPSQQPTSSAFEGPYSNHSSANAMGQMHHMGYSQHPHPQPQPQPMAQYPPNADPNIDLIWRGFDTASNEQLPVWLSDQTLGGGSVMQNGMDAFLLPNDYLPPAPQIW